LPHATAMGEPDQPERIAGLLRLSCSPDGSANASAVVDPRLRSIGIMTLLVERVGLDATRRGGWLDTGAHTVTAWAPGNPPPRRRPAFQPIFDPAHPEGVETNPHGRCRRGRHRCAGSGTYRCDRARRPELGVGEPRERPHLRAA